MELIRFESILMKILLMYMISFRKICLKLRCQIHRNVFNMVDFRAYCNDEKKLRSFMHESAKVALDEGYIFGDEGKGFERINMASPREYDCRMYGTDS